MFHFKFFLILLFLFTLNCATNKVSNNHGFNSLNTKYEKIIINNINKNDIIDIIGPPSSISEFDNNKWLYIERKKVNQSIFKLGIKKIDINNILVVQFSNIGILEKKKLLNLNDMNDVKYVKNITEKEFSQSTVMTGLLTSLREKINAPVKNRGKK